MSDKENVKGMKLGKILKRLRKKRTMTNYSVRIYEDQINTLHILKENGVIDSYSETMIALMDEFFNLLRKRYGDELFSIDPKYAEEGILKANKKVGRKPKKKSNSED